MDLNEWIAHEKSVCDVVGTTTLDVGEDQRDIGASVALVVRGWSTGVSMSDTGGLVLDTCALRDKSVDGARLCPEAGSDFDAFLDQPCAPLAGTAFRVGPRHVLTAAHILGRPISRYCFAFGVWLGADGVEFGDGRLALASPAVFRARSLVAKVDLGPQADWALIELDAVESELPPALDLKPWDPRARVELFGHPLGLPLKYVRGQPRPSLGLNYKVWLDSGAGMSGGPMIQAGAVVGVLHGDTAYGPKVHTNSQGQRCVDLTDPHCPKAQPFTHAARIRAALSPDFFTP